MRRHAVAHVVETFQIRLSRGGNQTVFPCRDALDLVEELEAMLRVLGGLVRVTLTRPFVLLALPLGNGPIGFGLDPCEVFRLTGGEAYCSLAQGPPLLAPCLA